MNKVLIKSLLALGIGVVLFIHADILWSQDTSKPAGDPAALEKKEEAKPPEVPEGKPDPIGANAGTRGIMSDQAPPEFKKMEIVVSEKDPDPKDASFNSLTKEVEFLGNQVGKNRAGINMVWTLITGFLVMFMQAGFAMVETGLTRYKNVAHTMFMNLSIYSIGIIGFYFVGFALMFGGFGAIAAFDGSNLLTKEFSLNIGGKEWGLFGYQGFMLAGKAFDTSVMTLFLFQMVFMDTTATIPTGGMAERWKLIAFVIYGFIISMFIYPIYGNWVWGGGWLSKLGAYYGLGHGHVDFAGSSVVHMVGGVTCFVGAWFIGPRIGKYNKDGSVNVLPAHNVPMYIIGTAILAFGWFGFNPGSTNAGVDLNIGRIATNTMLASASGALGATAYMWLRFGKPDPSFLCNGLLAGLVAITAPCAYVEPWAAFLIGLIAGVLVVVACMFIERVLKIDDPVGAVGVHGVNGAWGILATGLFADGTYGVGANGSYWYKMADGKLQWFAEKLKDLPEGVTEQGVTGLFYGNPSQLLAECIGIGANIVWVGLTAYLTFWIIEKLVGNRVSAADEIGGLDIPECGVLGYIEEDPKSPEGHISTMYHTMEPRHADMPPNGKRFMVVVNGVEAGVLKQIWSSLCLPREHPPATDFLSIYPYMTTLQGKTLTFRGGDPDLICSALERILRNYVPESTITARVQPRSSSPRPTDGVPSLA